MESASRIGVVNSVSGVIFPDGVFILFFFTVLRGGGVCGTYVAVYIILYLAVQNLTILTIFSVTALVHTNDLRNCYCRISSAKFSFIHIRAINKPQINAYDTATFCSGVSVESPDQSDSNTSVSLLRWDYGDLNLYRYTTSWHSLTDSITGVVTDR